MLPFIDTPQGRIAPGDNLQIIHLDNGPGGWDDSAYDGRKGTVKVIDDSRNIHGTWGGLAIIPEKDKFKKL